MDATLESLRSIVLGLRRAAQDHLLTAAHPRTSVVVAAAACWRRRRNRQEHPDGTFDRAKRWYPSDTERQDCCNRVRGPSRAWPYSYMTHCRSVDHVAALFDLPVSVVRRATRAQRLDAATLATLCADIPLPADRPAPVSTLPRVLRSLTEPTWWPRPAMPIPTSARTLRMEPQHDAV